MFPMKLFSLKKKIKKNDSLPRIKPGAGHSCNHLGFTLVEVIVVLAIMTIIISIIMVSMGNSRKKGEDAAIQSSLREIRNAAELFNDDNSTYDGICNDGDNSLADDGGNFQRIEDYINNHNGSAGELKCLDSVTGYAVISSLNLGDCWCVDYQGTSKKIELSGAETCSSKLTGITCP